MIVGGVMAKRAHIMINVAEKRFGNRFFIQQKALELGLKGNFRINENDQLEIDVEGKNQSIDEFLHFIQKGENLKSSLSIKTFDDLQGYEKLNFELL